MLRAGLTGGIGSGKSEVSRRLAALGAVVLDADQAARNVVAPGTPGLAQVVDAFGPGVLASDGSLDRPGLGKIVFGDEAARAKLNGIIHPLVRAYMRAAEERAIADGASAVIVHDIPLLAEGGRARSSGFDLVIVVDVPPELQIARLTASRGMTAGDVAARMAAQATREQRLAIADIVIDNSGTLADLDKRVSEVWADLRARAEASARH
jgi:dephospho-CoA kinase